MKLSVIIVSFNQAGLLRQALASVQKSEVPFPHETIVVDNASAEDVGAMVRREFPGVRFLRNEENLGFGRANNAGAAAARGELLLFLNSDAMVEPDALAKMVARMEADPQIGALGPLTLNGDGSFQLSFGRRISLLSEWDQRTRAPRREAGKMGSPPRRDLLRAVDWLSGSCLLTRRALFAGGEVFDPRFFLYFEDHDLCLRICGMGKKVLFWSEPAVVHLGGASVSAFSGTRVEYRRSQILLYRLWAPRLDRMLLPPYLRLKFGVRLLRLRLSPDRSRMDEISSCRKILGLLRAR